MRTLMYCGEAARAGVPLNTVEIVNEPHDDKHRLITSTVNVAWSELYADLYEGFVYEGVLRSSNPDREGEEWDSFAVASA